MLGRLRIALGVVVVAHVLVAAPADADVSGRVAGADRYATAAAVSASVFSPGVPVVFVVTGQSFPDALTAGPAAARAGGPVLLVGRDSLPAATASELERLRPSSIVVVGGEGAISAAVARHLEEHTSGSVVRVAGANRFGTAAAVSRHAFTTASVVYVAGGERFADALAGAPAAFGEGAPLLLVATSSVPSATAEEIRRLGARRVVILGGTASVDGHAEAQLRSLVPEVERVAGADRYETSAAAALRAGGTEVAHIATGAGYADALAAGPAAAISGGVILLARGNCIPPSVNHALATLRPARLIVLGGTAVLYTGVERLVLCPFAEATLRTPTVTGRPGAAWEQSTPDPDLVRFGSTWFNYATGSEYGNHISVLRSASAHPDDGWQTITGRRHGSTALPDPPSWQTVNTQWAPGVYSWRGRYVMFYAARVASHGKWCITVAEADRPEGPFADRSSGPIICQLDIGGSIDPQPFVDADGKPWLHWKNNDGSTADVSKVWAAPLDLATGTAVAGPVREVMAKDTQRYAWQTTLDNPQMVLVGGLHYLFYASGDWQDDTYRIGYAVCASPVGPCTSGDEPILSSYGDAAGPAGGTVEQAADGTWWISYHAWHPSCTNDGCGGTRRLFVAPLELR